MTETLGKDNPFRYRGYVWDEETGLYYLRSRYYDPSWGRFVNADNVLGNSSGLLNHNLVSYCGNNPITRSDTDGQKYTTPIAPGQNLLDIINEQTITFASADELLEEQLKIINNDVRYKTGGRSEK